MCLRRGCWATPPTRPAGSPGNTNKEGVFVQFVKGSVDIFIQLLICRDFSQLITFTVIVKKLFMAGFK